VAIGLQPPGQHELRLLLLLGDEANDVLIQAGRRRFGFDVCDEAVLVLRVDDVIEDLSAGSRARRGD
jgi:hypothetical protein